MASLQNRESPSNLAITVALGIVGAVTGFFFGQALSLGLFTSKSSKTGASRSDFGAQASDTESEDQELESPKQELASFSERNEECKLVLVVRTDLGMTKGKIAAQAGHATLACYKSFLKNAPDSPILRRWERYGQAKVAVQVKSEDELEMLQAQALSLGLCAQIIHDAGRTQIASGSATVLGVGPGPKSVVDQVTGHLKLL